MDFDENDNQQTGGHVSLEIDPNGENRSDDRTADLEKRLATLERQMVHMMSLLELLIENMMDVKTVTDEDNDEFGL